LIPISIFLSRKRISNKQLFSLVIGGLISSLPFMIFEYRHGFIQTQTLIRSISGEGMGGEIGIGKFVAVITMISRGITTYFSHLFVQNPYLIGSAWVAFLLYVKRKNLVSHKIFWIISSWVFLEIFAFSFNKKEISEYYFHNLNFIFMIPVVILMGYLFQEKKKLFYSLLFFIFSFNLFLLLDFPYNATGYNEKTQVARYIANSMKENNFNCIFVSYITDYGEAFGFRYLLWKNGIVTQSKANDAPVYTIVWPWKYSEDDVDVTYGLLGVIDPKDYTISTGQDCGSDANVTGSMLNFVN